MTSTVKEVPEAIDGLQMSSFGFTYSHCVLRKCRTRIRGGRKSRGDEGIERCGLRVCVSETKMTGPTPESPEVWKRV